VRREEAALAKISKKMIDEAVAVGGGPLVLWDGELRGFGVRVMPSGVKSFIADYRVGGRQQQQTIGRYGVLTLDKARDRARQILAAAADGKDPLAEKRAEAVAGITVAELADTYLKDGPAAKPNKKLSSWATDRSNIERHIKPVLGNRPVRKLAQAEIAKFQADVAAGRNRADVKTKRRGRAIVSGGPGTASRALAVLGAMLEFGMGRKLIPTNPAKGVPLMKLQRRERFLSEIEVARLAAAIVSLESTGDLSRTAAAAIRLLLLTGCRKGEILSLKWDWVDIERSCLRLPDSKTGAKAVPLGGAALAILVELPRKTEFVLPARKGDGHYIGLQKDFARVRERADLPRLRVHDIRHSFASFAIASGISLFITGKVLGHRQARTTEGYSPLSDDPLKQAAEQTSRRIARAMSKPVLGRVG
jgi:integrase